MPIGIILDTNFILIQPQFHLKIEQELEKRLNRKIKGIILSPIYEEIQNLSRRETKKERKNALMALQMIKDFEIVSVERHQNETVDDLILRLAKKWNTPVATNDRDLGKKLRKAGIAVIYLRQKSRLEVEGMIN